MKKIFIYAFLFCFIINPLFARDYKSIDDYAKDIPYEYNSNIKKMVKYLIRPYENGDEEAKARVIFSWIVYHIDYDYYKYNMIKDDKNFIEYKHEDDIFKTRVGVCADIAELYKRMAILAELDALYVTGLSKSQEAKFFDRDDRHAWNKVKIKGKWEIVDATWGGRKSQQTFADIFKNRIYQKSMKARLKKSNKEELYKARDQIINNDWFMSDEDFFNKTHQQKYQK